MKSSEKEHLIQELMRRTGKGKLACDISLSLSNGDIGKALERMKISYPGLEIKK